jgi:hypothetical protein
MLGADFKNLTTAEQTSEKQLPTTDNMKTAVRE